MLYGLLNVLISFLSHDRIIFYIIFTISNSDIDESTILQYHDYELLAQIRMCSHIAIIV